MAAGTLVPPLDVLLPLPADALGAVHLELVWPGGIPADVPFWLQPWLDAPHAPGDALFAVTR